MPANVNRNANSGPIAAAAAATGFQLIVSDGHSIAPVEWSAAAEAPDLVGKLDTWEIECAQASIPEMSLVEILDAAGELAALPHVVLRLIQMTSNPDVTAGDLEKVILTDPAVAARVLALANSAYFGLPRRVYFVREAVVFLGFKAVRNLAVTVTAVNMFLGRSDDRSIARAHLWHHSLDVALVSRTVAEYLHKGYRIDVNSEESFTAGLLHDIGKMVLDLAMPEQYLAAVRLMNEHNVRFTDVEQRLFPVAHTAIGAGLAERWNLPATLTDAITNHHTPTKAKVNPHLVAIVTLADELISYLNTIVDSQDQVSEMAPALRSSACSLLGIEQCELPELILVCQTEIDKGMALHGAA